MAEGRVPTCTSALASLYAQTQPLTNVTGVLKSLFVCMPGMVAHTSNPGTWQRQEESQTNTVNTVGSRLVASLQSLRNWGGLSPLVTVTGRTVENGKSCPLVLVESQGTLGSLGGCLVRLSGREEELSTFPLQTGRSD